MNNKKFSQWKEDMLAYKKLPYSDGVTPRKAIWKKNKATLWYYPTAEKKYKVPLFIIYSLVNQPFVLDLMEGASSIEAFVENGFDVYLLDFGKPGLEDNDLSIDVYVTDYIARGVQRALKHADAEEVTIIGYCLGGTLAAIYGAVAEEPIKNIILMVTPIDFSEIPVFDKLLKGVRDGDVSFNEYIEEIGIVPALSVEAGVRLITSPIYYSPYLSLFFRADDPTYVEKWRRFNTWTKGHIPLAGKTALQISEDLIKGNKLIKNQFMIHGKKVKLSNIFANLLVVVTENDRLVPKEQSLPIIDAVSSADKQYEILQGGHTGSNIKKGDLPGHLANWLPLRSEPLEK